MPHLPEDSAQPRWHDGELLTCIQSMKAFWLNDIVQAWPRVDAPRRPREVAARRPMTRSHPTRHSPHALQTRLAPGPGRGDRLLPPFPRGPPPPGGVPSAASLLGSFPFHE